MDADAARSRARIGFMRRGAANVVGATVDPLRAVHAGSPADAVVANAPSREEPPKRKARKRKALTRDESKLAQAAAQSTPRSTVKRERMPSDRASKRAFFAARIQRYRALSSVPEVGLYEDLSV